MIRRIWRFRLRTFLFVMTLATICMGWWVTWPGRTATRFARAVAAHDSERLSSICPGRDVFAEYGLENRKVTCRTVSARRRFADVVRARGDFYVVVTFVNEDYWGSPTKSHSTYTWFATV